MKNTVDYLTYILVAVAIGIVGVVSYKSCKPQATDDLEQISDEEDLSEYDDSYNAETGTDNDTSVVETPSTAPSTTKKTETAANTNPKVNTTKTSTNTTKEVSESDDDDEEDASTSSSTETSTSEANESASADYKYAVIAASYKEESNANSAVKTLKKKGYDAEIGWFKNGPKTVIVGRFNNLSEAQSLVNQLKKEGTFVDAYVHTKRDK